MKYAIMADIHANLEALEAALKDAREQGCSRHAFLGDFVGYCADPKACLEIIRSMDAPFVKGNHDEYCATDGLPDRINLRAARLVDWTRKRLSYEDRRWLGTLPYLATVENFTLVHATLDVPARWGYVFDTVAATASFAQQETQLCFFGHTHVPVAFVRDGTITGGAYSTLRIEAGKQYFVNVGSVGQPRDNNPKAAYAIYDLDESTVELRRVEYDAEAAQRKIRDAGLE